MERRLVLMRHAKSSWKSDAPSDHERPLNKRGRRDAPKIAETLLELGWLPDRVLSSDSTRTRETWARMQTVLDEPPEVRFTRTLYLAGVGEVAAEVANVEATVKTLMLLGHNGGWENVLHHLTGRPESLTTANAALLLSSGDTWPDAWNSAPSWRIERILRPKEIG